jgi:cephalosporin hydroxylase
MSSVLGPLKEAVKTLVDPVFFALSARELDALLRRFPTGKGGDILTITKHYRGAGWHKRLTAQQVEEELFRLAEWASALKPKNVIEIGTANGATLLLWARVAQKRVISIDLPGGIHGGGYPAQKARLYRQFTRGRPGVRIDLVRASSHDEATKRRVARLLDDEQVDVLYIDGDHRLEGVRRDFELWRDFVRPGGHIVFHDIVTHNPIHDCHVDELWRSLKRDYVGRTMEIVASPAQDWAGIGVLTV